jgi:hypothetical protein
VLRISTGAYNAGVKKAMFTGVGMSVTMGIIMLVYALSFWYGYQLIVKGTLTAGRVLTVYFSIIIGAMAIGQAAPSLAAFADGTWLVFKQLFPLCAVRFYGQIRLFQIWVHAMAALPYVAWTKAGHLSPPPSCSHCSCTTAKGAAHHMFSVIERTSAIDNLTDNGMLSRPRRLQAVSLIHTNRFLYLDATPALLLTIGRVSRISLQQP